MGRISWRTQGTPHCASCQAASDPANPPPIIRIGAFEAIFILFIIVIFLAHQGSETYVKNFMNNIFLFHLLSSDFK
jgi:hypothetical protein